MSRRKKMRSGAHRRRLKVVCRGEAELCGGRPTHWLEHLSRNMLNALEHQFDAARSVTLQDFSINRVTLHPSDPTTVEVEISATVVAPADHIEVTFVSPDEES